MVAGTVAWLIVAVVSFGPFSDEQPEVATVLDLAALATALGAIAGALYGLWRVLRVGYRWWKRRLVADLHQRLEVAEAKARHASMSVDAVMTRVGTREGDIELRKRRDGTE